MQKFEHINATSIQEAAELLGRYGGNAELIAGGTDVLGKMKDRILPSYPEALINLNTIPDLDAMEEKDGYLHIGPLTILEDIAESPLVRDKYKALAEAAARTASPHLREMGTLGGNLCQDIRCWYYRNPGDRFPCLRKGGGRCYAIEGNNQFHSIFGGSVEGGCYAVHPSDTAPALVALNAEIVTSKRILNAEGLFQVDVSRTTVLNRDEIVTEIRIPEPPEHTTSSFLKFAPRKSIDFAVVNCAAMVTTSAGKVSGARVCLNAVYVKPYRARKTEEALIGQELNEPNIESAAKAVIAEAKPMQHNGYMVNIAESMIKRCLSICAENY